MNGSNVNVRFKNDKGNNLITLSDFDYASTVLPALLISVQSQPKGKNDVFPMSTSLHQWKQCSQEAAPHYQTARQGVGDPEIQEPVEKSCDARKDFVEDPILLQDPRSM